MRPAALAPRLRRAAVAVALLVPTAVAGGQRSTYQALEVFSGALMLIRDQYLEPVDPEVLMDGAVRGIFAALDPDSTYLSPAETERYRNRAAGTGTIGIGLQKRYYLHVDDVLEGSPAALAGIERGAAILAIDGQSTRDTRIPVGHLLLAGPPGTPVELTLRSAEDADSETVALERALLPPPPVERRMLSEDTGYLRIRRFHEDTPVELGAAVVALQGAGATALALDLRGSRGGGCETGALAAGIFTEGVTARVVMRGADGTDSGATVEIPPGPAVFDGPLAAIVNQGTVCPGEVLAAALRTRRDAALVGSRTAGRTGRSQLVELPDGDALLLSTAHFRGADDEDILGVGVAPTLRPADLEVERDELDEDDPELDLALRALARLRTTPAGPA